MCAFNLLILEAPCRVQGVRLVESFSALPDSTMDLSLCTPLHYCRIYSLGFPTSSIIAGLRRPARRQCVGEVKLINHYEENSPELTCYSYRSMRSTANSSSSPVKYSTGTHCSGCRFNVIITGNLQEDRWAASSVAQQLAVICRKSSR